MFCGECGTQNPDTNQFCKNCGKPLRRSQPQAAPAQPVAAYQPVIQPVSSPPLYVPPVGGAQPQVVPQAAPPGYALVPVASPMEKMLTGAGIVGFLLSIVSLFRYPYVCGIIAIILGAVVIWKSENRKRKGVIIAGIGLIIGLGSIIVDMFYFTFFPPQAVSLMFFWALH
jgi:hypothetical protein